MQSSKEQQGEITKASSVINANKWRKNNRMGKARENESYQGDISCKDGLNKGQKWYGPNRSRRN